MILNLIHKALSIVEYILNIKRVIFLSSVLLVTIFYSMLIVYENSKQKKLIKNQELLKEAEASQSKLF